MASSIELNTSRALYLTVALRGWSVALILLSVCGGEALTSIFNQRGFLICLLRLLALRLHYQLISVGMVSQAIVSDPGSVLKEACRRLGRQRRNTLNSNILYVSHFHTVSLLRVGLLVLVICVYQELTNHGWGYQGYTGINRTYALLKSRRGEGGNHK